MDDGKEYLEAEDFAKGLAELDKEMSQNPWIVAFAPIELITAGGFLAVSYLKNRESTGDIDFLFDSEFSGDRDIHKAFRECALAVAKRLGYNRKWINTSMSIFVTAKTRQELFNQADQQNIVLYEGESLKIRAAPIEWALERKLRRIHAADRDRKAEFDLSDAVAMLKYMREQNDGPLEEEAIRTMNMNGFDVIPDHRTMKRVADEYRRTYGEDVFE
ncbi:uncharacterized protein N7506_008862 [Penicillium brevicompactum]|uniref:Uncharacterized protein n=1 Tax=Penicillium brevicompactum TaxID=5074 RepID=A0A9W9QME9_PENBR|nr:uncharacterized protein N7506_008862 [Penicillium brevicompactum]KAJ5325760.1 hypothetical protein N7506_008862 [Penicillium brevicompactum]KAJ5339459.1 hypothetical protein N7452_006187 [Penicillium brevicompactum]